MSSSMWVASDVYTLIEPPEPAGTIAAFDVSAPSIALSVDTVGRLTPVGNRVKNPKTPGGTIVAFVTKACAVAGGTR